MHGESDWSDDEPIAAAIERKIQAGMPDAHPINVSAQGGTVTLTGHVASQAIKDALLQLARDTKGVSNVTDNVVITGGNPLLDWNFPGRNVTERLEEADKGKL
jgi:hypothetical protein